MNPLLIWKNDNNSLRIMFFNSKYSLYNGDQLIIENYDSITPCNDFYVIGCIKQNNLYKYQLISTIGDKVFGNNQLFELITYDDKSNEFNFFNYYNKVTIQFPILSSEKQKLFNLFLQKIYGKKINSIGDIKDIIEKVTNKIESISDNDINTIIENLELANDLYLKLNKPEYLKEHLIVLDKNDEANLLNAINTNKLEIFVELTKSIIKNPKIYKLNIEIINKILSDNEVTSLNQTLILLNSIRDSFIEQMKKYKSTRYEIFKSMDSIEKYCTDKQTIKYFDEKDYNYIKSNTNLFFNIMYNQSNTHILELLQHYNIIEQQTKTSD